MRTSRDAGGLHGAALFRLAERIIAITSVVVLKDSHFPRFDVEDAFGGV